MRTLRIYRALLGAALRSELQYRSNLALWIVAGVAYQGVGLAFVWVVIRQFGSIASWSLGEIAFLYSMRLMSHALFTVPFAELFGIDYIVRDGHFDRFLVRPVSPFVQLVTRRIRLQSLGDLTGGATLLVVAAHLVRVDWSAGSVAFLVLAVLGGGLVEAAIQVFVSAFAFRMMSVRSLRMLVDRVINTFGGYPLSILPGVARSALTFALPLAFVAYLPATVLLNHTGELYVPAAFAWCTPVVGSVLWGVALWFWHRQIRHYMSSGH
ncbi:ABC transporter permease [Streptomyces odontomachi]|uniref:ABC transporter permease n=1 Tax=Streptomyces odontomachi TaxID=2944940 RepID=UPI00210DDB11|nr:ABC-2 family transporter protein [Streptomyces sp. ODS25]